MNAQNCLLFQKGDGAVVNSFTEWGIVCMKTPFSDGDELKKLPVRDWSDEDGEDVYIPSCLKVQAYDAEFELAYRGEELSDNPFDVHLAASRIASFRRWLIGADTQAGSGADLKIYSPFTRVGRQHCYLLKLSDKDLHVHLKQSGSNVYNENVATFKAVFRVCDPVTDIVLTEGESGNEG